MNNQLIEKIIAANKELCPEFVYQNPLLDKNVSKALSKSFIKILKMSNHNSSTNNKLRLSILENIRKVCAIEPEGHSKTDDYFTEFLTEFYQMSINECSANTADSVDKKLDAFLVRQLKSMDINSSSRSTLNPEVVQALINLNENGVYLDTLSRDIIHWNVETNNYLNVLRQLWNQNSSSTFTDDVSIKMKPQIEMMLLNVCNNLLTTRDQNIGELIKNNPDLVELLLKCSVSPQCFQMCCGILNFLFIMTNFDTELQKFIPEFVKSVRLSCPIESSCELYPYHLSSLIVLMDFDIHKLPEVLKEQYLQATLKHMQELHEKSETDLILLLSHFPQWFDIYFSKPNL